MSDSDKKLSPPYATYGSFKAFMNTLRETAVPARIDKSVFGNASGSIIYSVLNALRFLGLVNANGLPSEEFKALVNASDEDRKPLMADVLRVGYPVLFGAEIDLQTATAGQFDEAIRTEYEVTGSTIDKIAAFFISAAKEAEIPLSPHLQKRRPIATSSASKKSVRPRKKAAEQAQEKAASPSTSDHPSGAAKPLEYQLIDLMSEPDIEDDVKSSIWSLVQYLTARKAKKSEE